MKTETREIFRDYPVTGKRKKMDLEDKRCFDCDKPVYQKKFL